MKTKLIAVILFIICNILSASAMRGISTTLIVIEETENEFTNEKAATPFTDGIFLAMWDTPYIFFDMQVDKTIPMYGENPDIRPYLEDARQSGADALLIIKFCYNTYEKQGKLNMKTTDIPYILYSLQEMKVLKSGRKKIEMDRPVENASKNQILKGLGQDIIASIFN